MALFRSKKNKDLPVGAHDTSVVPAPAGRALPPRSAARAALPPDAHYARLTKGTRILRYIVTFLLLFFTVFMAFFFSDEITGEKLKLLLRNASFSLPGEEIRFTTLRYDADTEMDFASYREYFAVATTSGVRLYDFRGNVALSCAAAFSTPVIDAGNDYFLVYDREGKNYVLCNSVSHLYSGSEPYPIYTAGIADNGSYMILTCSSTYLSEVKVYNRSFRQARDICVDRYPFYAEYARDGKRLMLITYSATESGDVEGRIGVYTLGEDTALDYDIRTAGLPLFARMTENGGVRAVFSDRTVLYEDGEEKESWIWGSHYPPVRCGAQGNFLWLVFCHDEVHRAYEVALYDVKTGGAIRSYRVIGELRGVFSAGELLFVQNGKDLQVFAARRGAEESFPDLCPRRVLAGAEGTVFFCDSSQAVNYGDDERIRSLTGIAEEQNKKSNTENDQ